MRSLNGQSDIVQLAAVSIPSQDFRNQCIDLYCRPSSKTELSIPKTLKYKAKASELEDCDEFLKTIPINDALNRFLEFIDSHIHQGIGGNRKAILVAHNASSDSRVIASALVRTQLFDAFADKVYGFLDTLRLFRECYPHLSSYSQPNLVAFFLKGQYSAHNARHDSHLLQQLYSKALSPLVAKDTNLLSKASFDLKYVLRRYETQTKLNDNLLSFNPMMKKRIISRNAAKRLATNDLTVQHLKTVLSENGIDKLEEILHTVFGKREIGLKHCKNIIRYLSLQ